MNKFLIPTHLLEVLDKDMLDDICLRSINSKDYIIEEDQRGHNSGQYIKLITNDFVKYICLSGGDSTASRNSFILQNFPTAYQHYLMDEDSNKSFEYYIRDTRFPHPPYTIFAYKVLLTGNIKILNLDMVSASDRTDYDYRTPFIDFKQMRKMRLDLQQRNSGNTSTLFEETEEGISVYGKSYGANGRETTAICLALHNLVTLPIKVYNVNETDPQHLADVDPANRYILEFLGVEIDDGRMDFETTDEAIAKRDSKRYHYNLLQKFKEKKCYLCGCDIEYLIIGSHIHRVTDILHSNISEEEKQQQIIDGENGFWLCANHDKLFEYGLIYFEDDKLRVRNNLNDFQKKYVYESTFYMRKIYDSFNSNKDVNIIYTDNKDMMFSISPEHYTEKMHQYLEIHKNRTNKINEFDI